MVFLLCCVFSLRLFKTNRRAVLNQKKRKGEKENRVGLTIERHAIRKLRINASGFCLKRVFAGCSLSHRPDNLYEAGPFIEYTSILRL